MSSAPSSVSVFRAGEGLPRVGQAVWSMHGLEARTNEGDVLQFTFDEITIDRGGASGRMLFVRSTRQGGTIASEDPAFAAAMQAYSGGRFDAALALIDARAKKERHTWRFVVAALAAVAVLLAYGLYRVPELAARSVDALPIDVDKKIGELSFESMEADRPVLRGAAAQTAISTMLERLRPHARLPGLTLTFRVVDDPTLNAFCLPGGYIVVHSELIKRATRPEQVAGVLGHEIAHATLRHGMRGLVRQAGMAIGLQLLLGDVEGLAGLASSGAMTAVLNGYSREQELEADSEGVRMLRAARIDPSGLAEFFRLMKEEPGTELPGVLSWMSTHPDHDSRIANVQRLVAAQPAPTEPLAIDWDAVRASVGFASRGDAPSK